MDLNTESRSSREDGELEDGEICDDETEESFPLRRGEGSRPVRGGPSRARKLHQHPHNMIQHLGHQPPDFRLMLPYNRGPHGPHGHGPFPPSHRQQCGPSGPDRPPPSPAPPPPLLLPPVLGPHGEPSPRTSFWERSHDALGRFRHRAMPNGGRGGWNRGGRGGGTGRGPPGRYGPGEIHGNKKDSPLRKQKQPGRLVVARKPAHSVNREPDSVDESFEDLLSKYKQIQQELECIRKEETKALEPKDHTANITETRPGPEPVPYPDGLDQAQGPTVAEEQSELEKNEKKVFQAFNIKPLRQKLPAPISLDEPQKKGEELQEGGDAVPGDTDHEVKGEEQQRTTADAAESGQKAEEESMEVRNKKKTTTCVCCSEESDKEDISQHKCLLHRESSGSSDESVIFIDQPVVEEEELSELQLRLLALQSASKKWQQKEQQVMKKSKDRITKGVQDKTSNAAVVPGRQRVTTRSAAAAERSRTRPKPLDRDRDRIKTGPRPADRDCDRLPERDRTKACPKVGPKAPPDRGRALGRGHMTKKMISPGSAAKQAFRKQQLRTWKLQQQREQEEKRRQEEDERRKREDEIRRIRDLSNQDEQYNRFMKLVGGRTRTPSKSTDREHRKSAGKQGLDASGNLYQYDNYDEVAMDTDSETGSPVASPSHSQLSAEHPAGFNQSLYNDCTPFGLDFSQPFLPPLLSGVPPPPPPLPPPPDELEPPPKPPFADEEEEEEMLLRETCLMSMANKRVNTAEEKSSSSPASPDRPPAPALHQPIRGNLSTVSLNTVSQSRSKFTRGHHAARTPLLLPRHKSVVVSLNDSDDSDSDLDACSSTQTAFGGLEFMIKEARRTVEAAKPKAASGSEKENNPVRTPEALPEAKRVEYRLLKEEIASREKQKLLKEHSLSPRTSSSPAVSVSDTNPSGAAAAELRLSEAEQRLNKHRELLQRDEAVLRQLLQQELRKRESLKAAEAKVSKLREQLQASEKIVSANRTLLKKLQEQVHRVEHRVSIKKSQEARLEQELTQAQLLPVRGSKRRADSNQTVPRKLQHVDGTPRGSERQFAELIAQKQRLQQLESEYALKIQKLKQAQALRNRGVTPPELPLDPPLLPSSEPLEPQNQHQPPTAPFNVPQPSLHDLTQDKLTLDSEDVPEADNHEAELASSAAAPVRGTRRNSRRQSSSSFTKPNLEQPSATPAKDNSAKPAKVAAGCTPPTDESSGLDVDALQLRHLQQPQLGELLQRELQRLGGHNHNISMAQVVSVDLDVASIQSGSSELKPVPFGSYHSPLLVFRSYRFSPYYRTKEKLSLSSVTYSNIIDPKTCFCRFDLTGTCNDDDCRWQHMRNWTLTGNQLFQDLLSYNLSLISCSENTSDEDIRVATEKYMKKLFGPNKDRMGIDQKAVLLVSKVNESKRHVPPFTTCKDMRRWRPKPSGQSSCNHEEDSEDECGAKDLKSGNHEGVSRTSLSAMDVCVTSDDKRYFISETDDISNLESSVLESPRDTQLWIKLAFKYLNQNETSAAECLEAALNTLSRALESNCDDPEIWSHYLMLFSRRGSREEVQEMCEMAVEHAPNYQVWWNYLKLESSFEGKDYVCERLLQFLLSEASSEVTDRVSFQLMEALLYRVHLNLFTGRMESALAILQNALKSAVNRSVAEHLTAGDRALLWLSYIHLTEFDWLPSSLFNPADSGPSRLVSRESFLLPWRTQQDVRTPHNTLIALFQDAVHQCSDGSLSQSERTLACLPLHTNLIFLYRLLDRFDEGVSLCESLLATCPESCLLRDALADLHIRRGDGDRAVSMWLHALAECPNNAEVFYHSCTFLMAQDKTSAIVPLFRGFILSLCEEQQTQGQPVDVLRHVLGFPTVGLLRGPILRELQEQLSQQMPYLHLIHCRWQWLHGSVDDTVDAFERALGSAMKLEELHKLWMDYLVFSSSQRPKLFLDLVHRCLSTIPSRLEFPFNPAEFWSCYSFHNQVVRFYLSCLPQSQHALVLERLRYAMPNNTELGLRFLQQEWQDGNMEHLRFQVRMLSSNAPRCLAYWKIAIAVESELKAPSEVRLLYQQALNNLPLCAVLWKHRLLFESEGGGGGGAGRSDRLRRLLDRCQQVGVSLNQKMSDAHSQSAAGQTQTQ